MYKLDGRREEEVKNLLKSQTDMDWTDEKGLVITLGRPDPAKRIAQTSTNDIQLSQTEASCFLKMPKLLAKFHIITSAGERE